MSNSEKKKGERHMKQTVKHTKKGGGNTFNIFNLNRPFMVTNNN